MTTLTLTMVDGTTVILDIGYGGTLGQWRVSMLDRNANGGLSPGSNEGAIETPPGPATLTLGGTQTIGLAANPIVYRLLTWTDPDRTLTFAVPVDGFLSVPTFARSSSNSQTQTGYRSFRVGDIATLALS